MENIKKKRGRKPKIHSSETNPPKKRGRKPKNILDNNLNNVSIDKIYKPDIKLEKIQMNNIFYIYELILKI